MTFEPFDPNATQPVPPPAAPPQAAAPGPAFEPVAPEPTPVPVVQPAVRSSGGSGRLLNVALGVAVLIAATGIAFAAGRMTAPATAASTNQFSGVLNGNGGFRGNGGYFPNGDRNGGFVPGAGNGNGNGGGRFGLGGGLSITGTVDSVTADAVTIKTESGQLITIGTDGTTTYHQQAPASAADVQAGKTVIVQLSGGFRPGANGNGGGGNGAAGTITLGPAGSITVVP